VTGREPLRSDAWSTGNEDDVMAKQTAATARNHMARITVTEAVWGEFREAAQVRGISVTTYLGQLVSKEVTNLRAGAAKAESLTARHAVAALSDARSLRDDLAVIADRLALLTTHPELLDRGPRQDWGPGSRPRAMDERWEIRDGRPNRCNLPRMIISPTTGWSGSQVRNRFQTVRCRGTRSSRDRQDLAPAMGSNQPSARTSGSRLASVRFAPTSKFG
jgi:hypothetical protein